MVNDCDTVYEYLRIHEGELGSSDCSKNQGKRLENIERILTPVRWSWKSKGV